MDLIRLVNRCVIGGKDLKPRPGKVSIIFTVLNYIGGYFSLLP